MNCFFEFKFLKNSEQKYQTNKASLNYDIRLCIEQYRPHNFYMKIDRTQDFAVVDSNFRLPSPSLSLSFRPLPPSLSPPFNPAVRDLVESCKFLAGPGGAWPPNAFWHITEWSKKSGTPVLILR